MLMGTDMNTKKLKKQTGVPTKVFGSPTLRRSVCGSSRTSPRRGSTGPMQKDMGALQAQSTTDSTKTNVAVLDVRSDEETEKETVAKRKRHVEECHEPTDDLQLQLQLQDLQKIFANDTEVGSAKKAPENTPAMDRAPVEKRACVSPALAEHLTS
ncbi:hypothetical protein JTB14_037012 [Gonioctena quinquepunctata]|nr:hypothetical protein JTB14_037012 [Gonioctena quinquepunctata]